MPEYIKFATADGNEVLVEVDREEVASAPGGVTKAGLMGRKAGDAVATAQETFEQAVTRTVRYNVESVTRAIADLVERPAEIELAFGLKATGELGNIAIAKASAEASISLKLTWKHAPPE